MVWDETWGDQPRKQTDADAVVTDLSSSAPSPWQTTPSAPPAAPDNAVNKPFDTTPASTGSSSSTSTSGTSTSGTNTSGSTLTSGSGGTTKTPTSAEWWRYQDGREYASFDEYLRAHGILDPTKIGGQPTSSSTSTTTPSAANYGTSVNLNDNYLDQVIRAAFAKKGVQNPSQADVDYWKNKAKNPEMYSDGKVRVGWNGYWEDRLISGNASSNPALAGNDGVLDANVYASIYRAQSGGSSGSTFTPPDTSGIYPQTPTVPVQPQNSPFQPITPDQYSDPATQDLLNFVGQRAQDLTNYQTPRAIVDLVGKLTQAMDNTQNSSRFADTQSRIDSVVQMLDKMRTEYQTPQQFTDYLDTLGSQITATQNSPEYAQAQDTIKQILSQVTGDPYTATQGAALRAEHLSQLQESKARGLEQMRQTLASRGIPLDSGIAIHAERQIENEYQRNKALIERGLTIDAMNRADANRSVALNASQAGLNIENQRAQQILSYAKAAADAMREQDQVKKDYLTSAAQAALQASGIGLDNQNANQNQILTLMKTIADTVQGEPANQQSYLDKALTMYSLPVSIADQRFQDASAAANGQQANPSTLLQTLGQLSAQNAQVEAQNKANTTAMWGNILQTVGKIDWSKFFGKSA